MTDLPDTDTLKGLLAKATPALAANDAAQWAGPAEMEAAHG